jgi:hypothetical protein
MGFLTLASVMARSTDVASIGSLHPPQCLERHHAGRVTSGPLQGEVRAIADV